MPESIPKCCFKCSFDKMEELNLCFQANHKACNRVNQEKRQFLFSGGRQMGKTFFLDMAESERRMAAWFKELDLEDEEIINRAIQIIKRDLGKEKVYKALYGGFVEWKRTKTGMVSGTKRNKTAGIRIQLIPGDPKIHPNHTVYEDFVQYKKAAAMYKSPSGGSELKHPIEVRVKKNTESYEPPDQDWIVTDK